MKLGTKELDEWLGRKTLRKGDTGKDSAILQTLLNKVGIFCLVDGIFGPKSERCVESFQERRLLIADSIVGPMTKHELICACENKWTTYNVPWLHKSGVMVYGPHHPKLGYLPSTCGRTSTFGGPHDWGDLMYGQSLIAASTPMEVYTKYPELVRMGVFRQGIEELPIIEHPRTKKKYQTGISWMLNPESYYLAMRWSSAQRRLMAVDPSRYLVLVGIPSKNKWCVGVPTDYGPAKWTYRNSDLSYGFQRALTDGGNITDENVVLSWVAINTPKIGPT